METNARPVNFGLSIVPIAAPSPPAPRNDAASNRTISDAERAGQYRLIIEEGPSRGTFVYKTLDSVTGEVVRQFPREELVKLISSDAYSKGMVADTAV